MEGGENRSVGATAMNDVSSRSHAIFTVNIKITTNDGSTTNAKFHLVDLAGSERSKKTKATGKRFKEGVKINQGLLALGNVISALGGGSGQGGGYISYRDSKLTRLLQDSLGGNSVTLMIACVSPADYNIEETLSTLRYADRAKKIKNKPVKNEDSHEAEIKRLKEVVQDLRLQILEMSGAKNGRVSIVKVCTALCKQAKLEKDSENKSLRQKLSSLVMEINNLQSEHLMKEAFCNELIERFEKLRNLLLNSCPAEFALEDTKIFLEIGEQTKVIEELIKQFKDQVRDAPNQESFEDDDSFEDEVSTQKLQEYTTNQLEALKQIKTLERGLKIKQDLLDRKFVNAPFLNDESEKNINEYQNTIKNLEKELDELRAGATNSAARRDNNATKVNMDRKHKIDKLEKELEDIRKKCVNLEKTKKLAEQDRKRIEDLRKEIQEMKTARVQLIRQQRTDSERYKKWIATRDREINTLREKGKKTQNEMKRMERMHEKQQTVLKRKVEEAKAVNKRLQDAMDRNKKAQTMRPLSKPNAEKADVIQTYIDHELMFLMSTIDAKITMQSLMNDRGLLTERLMTLKATVTNNESFEDEIKQLEEDLEMRNTQIADIRQKVMQTDLEAKVKSIPDNFSSVAELKIAMGYIIRAVMDTREDFTSAKTKVEDLKMAYEASEERIEQINQEMRLNREQHHYGKAELERDFECKLSFMYQVSRMPASETQNENVGAPIYVSMAKQLSEYMRRNSTLEKRVEFLAKELDKELRNKEAAKDLKSRPKKVVGSNATFTKYEGPVDSDSDSEEFDIEDSFADPDWHLTPAQKKVSRIARRTTAMLKESIKNRLDGTGLLNNISETSDTSSRKRSSKGKVKCNCKGSCATKQCGCNKLGDFCTDTCKCSIACVNVPDDELMESDDATEEGASAGKENDGTPERKQAK